MEAMTATVEAARREIQGLVEDPPPGPWLVDAAVTALGRVIGHDGYCLFGVDPASQGAVGVFSRHGLTVPTDRSCSTTSRWRPTGTATSTLLSAPVKAGILGLTPRHGTPQPPTPRDPAPPTATTASCASC